MHCRCSHQFRNSILAANDFTHLDNVLNDRNQSMPIKSPQMTPVCESDRKPENSNNRGNG